MANQKIILYSFLFMILLALPTFATTTGVGVEPSIADVYLNNSHNLTYVQFKVYNPSETPDNYTIEIDDVLKPYMHYMCDGTYSGYWCLNQSIWVNSNTSRLNGIPVKILFMKTTNDTIEVIGNIYFNANPQTTTNGTIAFKPRVSARVTIHQVNETIALPNNATNQTNTTANTTNTTTNATTNATQNTTSSSNPPSFSSSSCTTYWWFDNSSKNCSQKSFCGAFMYNGLRTFSSKNLCETAFNQTLNKIAPVNNTTYSDIPAKNKTTLLPITEEISNETGNETVLDLQDEKKEIKEASVPFTIGSEIVMLAGVMILLFIGYFLYYTKFNVKTNGKRKTTTMLLIILFSIMLSPVAFAEISFVTDVVYDTNLSISNLGAEYVNSTHTLWADFYNSTNNASLSDANCSIAGIGQMVWNGSSSRFEAEVVLQSSVGSYDYTVVCSKEFYRSKNATDSYSTILNPSWLGTSNLVNADRNSTQLFYADFRTGDQLYELLNANCTVNKSDTATLHQLVYNGTSNRYEARLQVSENNTNGATAFFRCTKDLYETKNSTNTFNIVNATASMTISNIGSIDVLSTQNVWSNYTDISGNAILNANCTLSGDVEGQLSYNLSSERYEGSFIAQTPPDNYTYNVTCVKYPYDTKIASDTYETSYLTASLTISDLVEAVNTSSQLVWAGYQAGATPILNATCTAIGIFNTTLDYSIVNERYEKIVTAPAGIGTFNYTIFCNKTSHESKNATDIFNTTTTPSFSTYIVISDFTNIIENSTVKLWAYYENLSNNATITGANCTLSGFWNGSMTYNSSAGRYEKIVTAPALSGNETSENYTIACVKIELEGNYQLSQATDSFLLQYQPSATQFFVETATELGQGMGNMMNSVFTAVIYFVVSLAFAGAIITILII